MTSPLIRNVALTKIYDTGETRVEALRGVNLDIHQGEMVAIMGASGSGKSTLMHILGCLDRPTGGEYHLLGQDVSTLHRDELAHIRNRRIGFVFQNFNLLKHSTAWENVALPLIYAGVPDKEIRARAQASLARMGLQGRETHLPSQLSGGQQQRVAIARALVNEPSIILADEPTGALDTRTSEEVMALIQQLHEEQGLTVIIVTHEPEVAEYCQRLVRLRDGMIIEDRPVEQKKVPDRDPACEPEEALL